MFYNSVQEWFDAGMPFNSFINGDCMEGMQAMSDKFIDLCICDPPYGIGAGEKRKYHDNAFTSYISKKWDCNCPKAQYFDDLFRVSKNQIIWGGNYFTKYLPPAKNWIVWDKKQPDGISFSMHELAFYSGDGQAKIFRGYFGGNRCTVKKIAQKYIRIHPTQKPVVLYRWLLQNYTQAGWKILDTHVGSASSLIACEWEGFDYIGFEIDQEYFEAACKRMDREREKMKQMKLL